MKKTFTPFFVLVILLFMFTGCSQSDTVLTGTLSESVDKACSAADFSSVSFTYMQDEYSEEVLMYMYGIEDQAIIDNIEDFVLSQRSGMYAATFAVIQFKSGTDIAVIDTVQTLINDVYVQSLINALMPYDPTQTDLAQNYEFKRFGNSLVLVICEDNAAVFDAISK